MRISGLYFHPEYSDAEYLLDVLTIVGYVAIQCVKFHLLEFLKCLLEN